MARKLLSAILACSMVAAMGVSAFATDVTSIAEAGTDVGGDGTVKVPTISVTLPADFNFNVDPYGITGSTIGPAAATLIVNKSNVPIRVMANKVKGTPASTVNLVGKVPADTATTKDAFLYLRATVLSAPAFATDADTPNVADDATTGETNVVAADGLTAAADKKTIPQLKTESQAEYKKATAAIAGDILLSTTETAAPVLLCDLKRGAVENNGDSAATPAARVGSVAIVGIRGAAATKAVATPWAAGDTVAVATTLNLIPQVNTEKLPVAPTP